MQGVAEDPLMAPGVRQPTKAMVRLMPERTDSDERNFVFIIWSILINRNQPELAGPLNKKANYLSSTGELRMTLSETFSNFDAATPFPSCALKLSISSPFTSTHSMAGR